MPHLDDVEFSITPTAQGRITVSDLTKSLGTISFYVDNLPLENERLFFLSSPDYHFEIGQTDGIFYFQRNDDLLTKEMDIPSYSKNAVIFFNWKIDEISIGIFGGDYKLAVDNGADLEEETNKRIDILTTDPTYPPNNLVTWLKKHKLVQQTRYKTNEEFYDVVASSLRSIQDYVSDNHAINAFWNIVYEGSKIKRRLPKNEIDIQPTIKHLLDDVCTMKNMDIHSEEVAAGGNLDFLIEGIKEDASKIRVCVEFKNAHHSRLEHGLTDQLPKYMRAKGSDFGLFCVMYFKGEWFDRPDESLHQLTVRLKSLAIELGYRDINVVTLDFSKHKPPSVI